MSGNMQYKNEFDKNSGKPADFDSLFRFDGEEIVAKRRIRMHSGKKRALWMTSSAAVIMAAAVFGLSWLGSSGIDSDEGVCELADVTEAQMNELSEYIENESEVSLSDLLSRFDYNLAALSDDEYSELIEGGSIAEITSDAYKNADIIMNAQVVGKTYYGSDIMYTLYPIEYYYLQDISFEPGENIIVSSAFYHVGGAYSELQTGSEYIVALDLESDNTSIANCRMANPYAFPMRKTDHGWLVPADFSAFSENTESVINDIDGFYDYGDLVLEKSDENMKSKLYSYCADSDKKYYYADVGTNDTNGTAMFDLFDYSSENLDFESVKHYIKEDGSTDKTVLVLENEKYFELIPAISGEVIFIGKNVFGENIEVIQTSMVGNAAEAQTAVFVGMSEITVSVGDSVAGDIIGKCSDAPVYCRFIGMYGPIEVDIYDWEDTTQVISETVVSAETN